MTVSWGLTLRPCGGDASILRTIAGIRPISIVLLGLVDLSLFFKKSHWKLAFDVKRTDTKIRFLAFTNFYALNFKDRLLKCREIPNIAKALECLCLCSFSLYWPSTSLPFAHSLDFFTVLFFFTSFILVGPSFVTYLNPLLSNPSFDLLGFNFLLLLMGICLIWAPFSNTEGNGRACSESNRSEHSLKGQPQ